MPEATGTMVNFGPGNGLSPDKHQAINRTSVDVLTIEPLETNFIEISIKIWTFFFLSKKCINLQMVSAK